MAEDAATTPQAEEVAPPPITDEMSAIAGISEMLNTEEIPSKAPLQQDAETTPEAGESQAKKPEPEPEGEAEAEPEKTVEVETDEAADNVEPNDEQTLELPTTLKELAEAYETDPTKLAGTLKIPINDEGDTVTLAEAIRGHLRESAFTQKSQELADERRKFEAGIQQVSENWNQKIAATDQLISTLSDQINLGPSDQEIEELYLVDAGEGALAERARNKQVSALREAVQMREQEAAVQVEQNQQRMGQYRQEQQKLLAGMIPEMGEEKFRKDFEANIYQGLPKNYGFNTDEVSAFMGGQFDARYIPVIRDALAYQALQEGKKQMTKELKPKPPVVKPGRGRRAKVAGDRRSESQKRLRQTGSRDDGVEFIKSFLD